MRWLAGRLTAQTGDITRMSVDAIVNAANSSLLGGGGVDGAIHRVGGPNILADCRQIRKTRYPQGLPPGKAVYTRAGKLPCRYVIHTVGPIWQGGGKNEDEILADAYRNSLELAAEIGAHSLAFPAVSTGVYGFPADRAARIVWKILSARIPHNKLPEKVILVFHSMNDLSAFLDSVPPPDVS